MSYDDRSVKPMNASLIQTQIATKILTKLYEDMPTMLTNTIHLIMELPNGSTTSNPPYPFTININPT